MAEYVITDGNRFIYRNHTGKYIPASCEALADKFSKKQADLIYKNQLPKALKAVFYIEKYDSPPKDVKQVDSEEIKKNMEQVMCAENIQKWISRVKDLNGLANEASIRKEFLLQELSKVDMELSDINHYIEFSNLNAAQGYNASKMIKERRIRRRSVKNELAVLDMILDKKLGESISKELIHSVEALDHRTYKPRVLDELFNL